MPVPDLTTWAQVDRGDTVIDRFGKPREVISIQHLYDGILVTDAEGIYNLDPGRPVIVMRLTDAEAIVLLIVTFGATIIHQEG